MKFDPNEIYQNIESTLEKSANDEEQVFSYEEDNMAVYAIQGRRPSMEDRFQYKKSLNGDVQLYGVFDGHGGSVSITSSTNILMS